MRIKCLVCTDPDPAAFSMRGSGSRFKNFKKLTYEGVKLKKKKNLLKSKENVAGPILL